MNSAGDGSCWQAVRVGTGIADTAQVLPSPPHDTHWARMRRIRVCLHCGLRRGDDCDVVELGGVIRYVQLHVRLVRDRCCLPCDTLLAQRPLEGRDDHPGTVFFRSAKGRRSQDHQPVMVQLGFQDNLATGRRRLPPPVASPLQARLPAAMPASTSPLPIRDRIMTRRYMATLPPGLGRRGAARPTCVAYPI